MVESCAEGAAISPPTVRVENTLQSVVVMLEPIIEEKAILDVVRRVPIVTLDITVMFCEVREDVTAVLILAYGTVIVEPIVSDEYTLALITLMVEPTVELIYASGAVNEVSTVRVERTRNVFDSIVEPTKEDVI